MKLYLSRCTSSLSSGGCVPLFLIYDALGQLYGRVEQLSGLFGDGFRICSISAEDPNPVRIAVHRLPGGRQYGVLSGAHIRARLTVLDNGVVLRVEVDRMPCSLLGTPQLGEYTMTDSQGRVLFSQSRHLSAEGIGGYTLTVPDEARADVYLAVAVCLSRNPAVKSGSYRPVAADP